MGKSRTEAQALMNAEYSESYARSGQIKHTKGWQELMDQELPDNELLKVHKEGLKATKRAYEGDIEPDYPTRHKYLDSAYKVKGLRRLWLTLW